MHAAPVPDPSVPAGQGHGQDTLTDAESGGDGKTIPFPPARASMDTLAAPDGDGASVRPAQDPWLGQLPGLLREEAERLAQHGSHSMSVALRIGDQTEVLAHFTRHPGGLEVQVRCEDDDFSRLNALWPSLVQALGPRLRVAPLRAPAGSVAGNIPATQRCQAERRRRFRRPGWQKSA